MTLSQILRSNATFSLVSGFALAMMPTYLSQIFEVENSLIFQIVGIALQFFSATVFYASVTPFEKQKQVLWIIIQDALWVLGSAVIIVFQLFSLSNIGYWLILSVALIVAVFGFYQYKLLKINIL